MRFPSPGRPRAPRNHPFPPAAPLREDFFRHTAAAAGRRGSFPRHPRNGSGAGQGAISLAGPAILARQAPGDSKAPRGHGIPCRCAGPCRCDAPADPRDAGRRQFAGVGGRKTAIPGAPAHFKPPSGHRPGGGRITPASEPYTCGFCARNGAEAGLRRPWGVLVPK